MSVIDRPPASVPASPEDALVARLGERVVLPGTEGWDAARGAWNLAVDQHPAAVVLAQSAEDVVAAVEIAAAHGLRVAAQGTGHGAGPRGSLAGAILVKTTAMRELRVEPALRRARVEAGVLWSELAAAAAPHGLAGLAGSAGDVGVVGYSLGGGMGWLARRYGLAASSVLAVEVVTADARLVRVDAEHEAELFWALRGGGGSFGVVTAVEIALYAVAEAYAGWLIWPMERAPEVLRAYAAWAEDAPDDVTACGRLLQLPPIPEIPEPLRGRSLVVVEAAFIGDRDEADELLRPLRALAPEMDTFATIGAPALGELHHDPPAPVPGAGDGAVLAELPPEAVDALVAVAGDGSGSPLLSVELRQLGGAVGRRAPGGGATASVEGAFALFAVGIAPTPEAIAAVEAAARAVRDALAPWHAAVHYLNFREASGAAGSAFAPETFDRLRRVKAQHDPNDLFLSNHPIPPAA